MVQTPQFWENESLDALEGVRRELREIVHLLKEQRQNKKFVIDIEDEYTISKAPVNVVIQTTYKQRVIDYLAENSNNETLRKIQNFEQLTAADIQELERIFFEELGTIVSTACLAHDMGNPPFGHSGEKAIQAFFREGRGLALKPCVSAQMWEDLTHFEGNANAFRLLTHRFHGRRDGGFVMTYSTLASIVKYPYSSECAGKKGKFGFFCFEQEAFQRIADDLGMLRLSAEGEPLRYARHPLVYLVEAADDICYEIMDIEDAHKLRILSYGEASGLLLGFFSDESRKNILDRIEEEGITDNNEKIVYMRACAIGLLENECAKAFVQHEQEILAGTLQGSLIDHVAPLVRDAYRHCTEVSVQRIYNSKPVLDVELSGYKIMETLMDTLIEAATAPGKFHSEQLRKRFSSQYDINSDDFATRVMAVIDYISGMTDIFALDIYQKIQGISLPIV